MKQYIEPPKSRACNWRKGPPPAVGWWPAGIRRDPTVLRWWNGKTWSSYANSRWRVIEAAPRAAIYPIFDLQHEIEWCDPWW